MRLVILLILGLGLIIFFLQNSAPIALVFWSTIKTPSLPVAVWIVLFALAGMLSSLLLQMLSQYPKEVSSNRNYPREQVSYSNQAPRSPSPETRNFQPIDSESSPSDGVVDEDEDWDIEAPPKQATRPQYPPPPVVEKKEEEAPPQPIPRSPSPYSYVYKEKETIKSPQKKTTKQAPETVKRDQVYDANYRVITPANKEYNTPTERPLEDDEEWV